MKDAELDAVFAALSSAPRRRMLDLLKLRPGSTVGSIGEHFDAQMSRFGVMKHLAVLERAGLVTSEAQGRERRLWTNNAPLQLIHERWSTEFSAYWAAQLTHLKYRAEGALVKPFPSSKSRKHRA